MPYSGINQFKKMIYVLINQEYISDRIAKPQSNCDGFALYYDFRGPWNVELQISNLTYLFLLSVY